ncbi:transcription factor C subunit 7 [Cryptococcus deuterogattii 99/473]|uniref:Unplaced genomic scaffold supercont1.14, whole genome shotgun sequence n=1 Tax=Cryptococcus deuterogattii Ram5 TaxID=1296110 RepID=A0A0D0UXD6_9TREE|nr:transcription factor C subunit 7 [Cryptococcus deuterogattii Ram5]KIY57831.1 transcription factor C subunit 7 [Cryptococcus deuterogattii 99/473]
MKSGVQKDFLEKREKKRETGDLASAYGYAVITSRLLSEYLKNSLPPASSSTFPSGYTEHPSQPIPMLKYIYVCRHGFRSNWVDPSIKSGPTGMNRDPPTALPTAQALGLTLAEGESFDDENEGDKQIPAEGQKEKRGETKRKRKSRKGLHLEHGVGEWYSPVYPNTGLHPRPAPSHVLSPLFPPGSINPSYQPTLFPSRKGESLESLHERAELFIDAWTRRVEGEWPDVKCVVIFAHAASIIALGRALTGDRSLEVIAGCATTSLYARKPSPSSSSSSTIPNPGSSQYTLLYSGRYDYLPLGLERDWSFADVVLTPDGEVVGDHGDEGGHEGEEWEEGLTQVGKQWLEDTRFERERL